MVGRGVVANRFFRPGDSVPGEPRRHPVCRGVGPTGDARVRRGTGRPPGAPHPVERHRGRDRDGVGCHVWPADPLLRHYVRPLTRGGALHPSRRQERARGYDKGLQRRSIDGSLEQAYSTSNHPSAALPTPDGLDIFAEVDNGLALLGNGGTLVRSFSSPAGYERCGPLRWWQPGVALTVCLQMGTPITNLFLYPISGAPVTQLTKATNAAPGGQNAPFGFVAAWRYSGGTLVQYGAGCGLGGVGMLSPDGLTTPRRLNIAATGNDGGPSLSVVNAPHTSRLSAALARTPSPSPPTTS